MRRRERHRESGKGRKGGKWIELIAYWFVNENVRAKTSK